MNSESRWKRTTRMLVSWWVAYSVALPVNDIALSWGLPWWSALLMAVGTALMVAGLVFEALTP